MLSRLLRCQPREIEKLNVAFLPLLVLRGPHPLVAAPWTLVILDVLSLCRGDLHALPMEPLLTSIAEDPEVIWYRALAACRTEIIVFIVLLD